MKPETVAEQLFLTTVRIEASNGSKKWSGTGFYYSHNLDGGQQITLLVSNKHVLEDANQITFHFLAREGEEVKLGEPIDVSIKGDFLTLITSHPDPNVDVACFPVGSLLAGMEANAKPVYHMCFTPDQCMTPNNAKDLDALERVLFVGYPNGIYDRTNLLPVVRAGQTASPPSIDYGGEPAFLIDASVFPGSSGSPVVLYDRGGYVNRDGTNIVGGGRFMLMGILAAVHQRQVSGEVSTLPTQRLGFSFGEPIDLGIVYKSTAIIQVAEMVTQKLLRLGLVRIDDHKVNGQPQATE